MSAAACPCRIDHVLRFEPLVEGEHVLELPCDEVGRVALDSLDEAQRNAYFYARRVRRRRLAAHVVRSAD